MARISGIDLPRDKRIEVALTYIYGIGPSRASEVLAKTGIDPDTRVKDLTEEQEAITSSSPRTRPVFLMYCCFENRNSLSATRLSHCQLVIRFPLSVFPGFST